MAGSSQDQHPWFQTYHPRPTAKYQVFIFPSSGNPGAFYRPWGQDFPEYEFSLVIYPGRTTRFREKLITNMGEYMDQMDKGLVPFITKPCVFIGHSLGCMISFALAKHMVETGNKANLIRLMVQMGREPPHVDVSSGSYSRMTDAQLINVLKTIADPNTRYIYDVPCYTDMLLPVLRADGEVGFGMIEKTQLDIPIIVYGGDKEFSDQSIIQRWKELTTAEDLFRIRMFPGHHNFQSECAAQVLQCLKEDLNNLVDRSGN